MNNKQFIEDYKEAFGEKASLASPMLLTLGRAKIHFALLSLNRNIAHCFLA